MVLLSVLKKTKKHFTDLRCEPKIASRSVVKKQKIKQKSEHINRALQKKPN